jgi:4-hydroxyphenylacetate decarboxylase small subunit
VNTNRIHLDCRNYAPIDVVKGICHRTKTVVAGDQSACESFDPLPRCRLCRLYTAGEQASIGTCAATPDRPMTYPDLAAVTCEWYAPKDG